MSKKKEMYAPLTRWQYFTKTLYHDPSKTQEFEYDGVIYLKSQELQDIEERNARVNWVLLLVLCAMFLTAIKWQNIVVIAVGMVVIVAGDTDLMDRFIHSNPGLESRFNRFLLFDDYTIDEMVEIFRMQCKKGCYQLTEEARPLIRDYIAKESADDSFGNARGVRNLFEHVLVAQNNRLATMEKITREDLMTITADDVLRARGKVD